MDLRPRLLRKSYHVRARTRDCRAPAEYNYPMRTALVLLSLTASLMAAEPKAEIATSVAFTEGPTVDREGNVYFTETISQRIMKLSVDGVLTTFREHSNAANGLIFDSQWRLIACEGNRQNPRVTRTDKHTGRIDVLA